MKRINFLLSLVPLGFMSFWLFFGLPFCCLCDGFGQWGFYWIFCSPSISIRRTEARQGLALWTNNFLFPFLHFDVVPAIISFHFISQFQIENYNLMLLQTIKQWEKVHHNPFLIFKWTWWWNNLIYLVYALMCKC